MAPPRHYPDNAAKQRAYRVRQAQARCAEQAAKGLPAAPPCPPCPAAPGGRHSSPTPGCAWRRPATRCSPTTTTGPRPGSRASARPRCRTNSTAWGRPSTIWTRCRRASATAARRRPPACGYVDSSATYPHIHRPYDDDDTDHPRKVQGPCDRSRKEVIAPPHQHAHASSP